jgi:hypothetical protein
VSGDALVYGYALVFGNAKVFGNAQVFGSALVYGEVKVCGRVSITRCLYVYQFKHSITATDTHVFIGCEGHTWEHWFKNIAAIGKENGYSKTEIANVLALLKVLHKQIKAKIKEKRS